MCWVKDFIKMPLLHISYFELIGQKCPRTQSAREKCPHN